MDILYAFCRLFQLDVPEGNVLKLMSRLIKAAELDGRAVVPVIFPCVVIKKSSEKMHPGEVAVLDDGRDSGTFAVVVEGDRMYHYVGSCYISDGYAPYIASAFFGGFDLNA